MHRKELLAEYHEWRFEERCHGVKIKLADEIANECLKVLLPW